jgi:anti-sigma factor RsiW
VVVHIGADELAEAADGSLPSTRGPTVDHHLAECPECADAVTALAEVSALLHAERTAIMPAGVADRLDAVIAAETRRRA